MVQGLSASMAQVSYLFLLRHTILAGNPQIILNKTSSLSEASQSISECSLDYMNVMILSQFQLEKKKKKR